MYIGSSSFVDEDTGDIVDQEVDYGDELHNDREEPSQLDYNNCHVVTGESSPELLVDMVDEEVPTSEDHAIVPSMSSNLAAVSEHLLSSLPDTSKHEDLQEDESPASGANVSTSVNLKSVICAKLPVSSMANILWTGKNSKSSSSSGSRNSGSSSSSGRASSSYNISNNWGSSSSSTNSGTSSSSNSSSSCNFKNIDSSRNYLSRWKDNDYSRRLNSRMNMSSSRALAQKSSISGKTSAGVTGYRRHLKSRSISIETRRAVEGSCRLESRKGKRASGGSSSRAVRVNESSKDRDKLQRSRYDSYSRDVYLRQENDHRLNSSSIGEAKPYGPSNSDVNNNGVSNGSRNSSSGIHIVGVFRERGQIRTTFKDNLKRARLHSSLDKDDRDLLRKRIQTSERIGDLGYRNDDMARSSKRLTTSSRSYHGGAISNNTAAVNSNRSYHGDLPPNNAAVIKSCRLHYVDRPSKNTDSRDSFRFAHRSAKSSSASSLQKSSDFTKLGCKIDDRNLRTTGYSESIEALNLRQASRNTNLSRNAESTSRDRNFRDSERKGRSRSATRGDCKKAFSRFRNTGGSRESSVSLNRGHRDIKRNENTSRHSANILETNKVRGSRSIVENQSTHIAGDRNKSGREDPSHIISSRVIGRTTKDSSTRSMDARCSEDRVLNNGCELLSCHNAPPQLRRETAAVYSTGKHAVSDPRFSDSSSQKVKSSLGGADQGTGGALKSLSSVSHATSRAVCASAPSVSSTGMSTFPNLGGTRTSTSNAVPMSGLPISSQPPASLDPSNTAPHRMDPRRFGDASIKSTSFQRDIQDTGYSNEGSRYSTFNNSGPCNIHASPTFNSSHPVGRFQVPPIQHHQMSRHAPQRHPSEMLMGPGSRGERLNNPPHTLFHPGHRSIPIPGHFPHGDPPLSQSQMPHHLLHYPVRPFHPALSGRAPSGVPPGVPPVNLEFKAPSTANFRTSNSAMSRPVSGYNFGYTI